MKKKDFLDINPNTFTKMCKKYVGFVECGNNIHLSAWMNQLYSHLWAVKDQVNSWKAAPATTLMCQDTFDDLVKWSEDKDNDEDDI